MLPPDIPSLDIDKILQSVLEEHLAVRQTSILQSVSDDGGDISLIGISAGTMFLRLFLLIRDASGALGAPLEAELHQADDSTVRYPLYRSEAPWWHSTPGMATLMAPVPLTNRPLRLKIRQIRLFGTGPGSRELKVRVLAPTPQQPPPIKLPGGIEERYRATVKPARPTESFRDVSGYWDFDFTPPTVPHPSTRSVRATVTAYEHSIHILQAGPRTLYGEHTIDFTGAFQGGAAWDGFSTLTLNGVLHGIGTIAADGTASWVFAEDLPEEAVVTEMRLFKLPLAPVLTAESTTLTALPLISHAPCTVVVTDPQMRTVLLVPEIFADLFSQATETRLHFITTRYGLQCSGDAGGNPPRHIRPWFRFHADSRVYDRPMPWDTPPGHAYIPVEANSPPPTRWDAPFANFIFTQDVPLERRPEKEPSPLRSSTFFPPWLYSGIPMAMR